MAYHAASTCLVNAIQQSVQLTGCNLQSFYENIESLIAILEKSLEEIGDDDVEVLTSVEAEITELAYKAEDMVDLKSRRTFLAETAEERTITLWELFFLLEQAIDCIGFTIKQYLMAIRDRYNSTKDLKSHSFSLASIPEHAVEPDNMMVGHENTFEMMQDQLAGGESELEVISIVGMGGIGKTTLANKIYTDPYTMSHFDIRAKATVSQKYCARNILLGLLSSTNGKTDELYKQQDDGQLADRLQKILKGRRYLIVIDDIWTIEAWDDIKLCFPDCNCGSRILMTTRNMEVAEYASSGKPPYQMRLLNFDESWSLLYDKVFLNEYLSAEFELLGKQIASKCGGLPLAIVVIAGLLSKIGKELNEWQSILENVISSLVSTDVNVQCMKVLALSYHHLPHHLRACFLYFAIFLEDEFIYVNNLMDLWLAEGFLKAKETKSIGEVAEECLKELIDRNLIFIESVSLLGKIEACRMHDVIHELCLREAQNMNFVNVIGGKNDENPCAQSMHFSSKSRGRISIHNEIELARCHHSEPRSIFLFQESRQELLCFKLVRVLDLAFITFYTFPTEILDLIHLKFLSLSLLPTMRSLPEVGNPTSVDIPPSISSLVYLQTFILKCPPSKSFKNPFVLPLEMLKIPQLRHLSLEWNYLYYLVPIEISTVLKNLECLSGWNPLYCTSSIFRLIPNVKKLDICGIGHDYRCRSKDKVLQDLCYLDHLHKLSFRMLATENEEDILYRVDHPCWGKLKGSPFIVLPPREAFPQNLKNLTLYKTCLKWKNLGVVGKLPQLEALELFDACIGKEWEVVEEGFPQLKFLQLKFLEIRYWRASSNHFPCLQRLSFEHCWLLDSIPQDFAEITTLDLIKIRYCRQSVENSAKQIQYDIEENYGGSIEISIS